DALINPGIAEIVQHMGLLGLQLERLAHICLRLAPLFGTLLANAAVIVMDAVGLVVVWRQCVDTQRVGLGAVGKLLAAALDIAKRHDGLEILGILRRDGFQDLDRFVAALCGESTSGDSFLQALVSRRPSNTRGCRASFLSNAS